MERFILATMYRSPWMVCARPFMGKVSYISPRAEYTPPVIYSQESRDKLVFMVEVVFDPQRAGNLNPGQPVDVRFESAL